MFLRGGAELAVGGGFGEGFMGFAGGENTVDGGGVRDFDFEDRQHDFDAGEADIGDCDGIAMAECSSFGFRLQALFEGLQAGCEPVDAPGADGGGIEPAGFGEVFDDAGGDEGVRVRHQHGGERADAGAAVRVRREAGGGWVDVFEEFQDGEGLGHRRDGGWGLCIDEGGDGAEGVDFKERFAALLTGVEVDVALIGGDAFEVHGDADAVAGGGAPIGEKLEAGVGGHGGAPGV